MIDVWTEEHLRNESKNCVRFFSSQTDSVPLFELEPSLVEIREGKISKNLKLSI